MLKIGKYFQNQTHPYRLKQNIFSFYYTHKIVLFDFQQNVIISLDCPHKTAYFQQNLVIYLKIIAILPEI